MARDDSDVDIFIEAEQADRFNAFDLIDVKTLLEPSETGRAATAVCSRDCSK